MNVSIPYVDDLEQRGYADLIEKEIAKHYASDPGFAKARSKRSIEDFSIRNETTTWYDVKSFDVGSDFSMPNLISIDRLRKLMLTNDSLVYILVHYRLDHDAKKVIIESVENRPIESLDPTILAIQNLGKGVLQVKSMHNALTKYEGDRKSWMKSISTMATEFYRKQIIKFTKLEREWHYE